VSVVAIMTESKFFSFSKRKSKHYMNKHAQHRIHKNLSLCFNGHFPGEPGLAGVCWS